MGHLYLRGEVWWAKFYLPGRKEPIYESTKCRKDNKRGAKKFLADRESSRNPAQSGRLLFKELLVDYLRDLADNNRKAIKDVTDRLGKHVFPALGHIPAASITVAVLNHYINSRKRAKAANGTINRELAFIHRALVLGAYAGKIQNVPMIRRLKESPPRTDHYTQDEQATLLSHLPQHVQAIVRFAPMTGWRKSEILRLQWENVDFERNEIRLLPGTSKNDAPRVVIMTPEMRELLLDQKRKAEASPRPDCPWVFHRNGLQVKSIRTAWEKGRLEAKMNGKTFHGFRRTASMVFDRAGISDRVSMAIMGHKTRAMFDRYRQVPRQDLEEAAQKLEEKGYNLVTVEASDK